MAYRQQGLMVARKSKNILEIKDLLKDNIVI